MIFLPADSWEIQQTAQKGLGLFAKKNISPGVIIGDYLGIVLNPLVDEIGEKDQGLYLLYYHDRALIYPANIAEAGVHLINHSCMPNCWIYVYRGHTLIFSLRQIFKGEELTIAYLLAPNTHCSPCTHQCYCLERNCAGSMHLSVERYEKWDQFIRQQSNKTRRLPVKYGALLPKLAEYPLQIPDDPIYSLFGSRIEASLVLADPAISAISELRRLIRDSGKTLFFPKLNKKIIGIEDGLITFAD